MPDLILLLKDERPNEINSVIEALGGIGKIGEKAVPALILALKNQDKSVKSSAVKVLGNIGEKAVPALILVLNSQDQRARLFAIEALGKIGEKAEKAVSDLILLLKDEDESVRRSVIEALGEKAEKAVPDLILLLKDKDSYLRSSVIKALGEKARKALPALILALKDQSWEVRRSAAWVLGKIGEKALPSIRSFIQNKEDKLGLEALNSYFWDYVYIKESKKAFSQIDIELLSQSTDKNHLDTVAAIYAWQGNRKKANDYAVKALEKTTKRLKLLLEGKSLKQVEEEMRKK
ncbi:HEAT repeat-containing PBS lyase [Candidatus Uabimicrobium amorphum]|uniref:HEAT repeat-containing PBS lyase n=1 Tax=Uabimicrobium amorphum TaxID=2596890 RepID=A0A5S9F3N6_UABAM|nr:HEAT repeat-containing PBS lyase [Candidatus Uabimicrobium amorphum]